MIKMISIVINTSRTLQSMISCVQAKATLISQVCNSMTPFMSLKGPHVWKLKRGAIQTSFRSIKWAPCRFLRREGHSIHIMSDKWRILIAVHIISSIIAKDHHRCRVVIHRLLTIWGIFARLLTMIKMSKAQTNFFKIPTCQICQFLKERDSNNCTSTVLQWVTSNL